ncbi:rolling circle replication-associated protein [Enterococcus wangshanyuanii]|uniref:Replication-associated protein ORF2/G2P domain-containing protein n=1 Tax=Enterococcus wangshanyuanii TaxID=2005703 RepID=A0ABQ1NWG4_9ENTE|nr:hypothetical protein [Enterococcus wangshanyuanii]GGC84479.1 hypothetical protein GCM10011573_12650 [Enterococcus wangshanyuanii]
MFIREKRISCGWYMETDLIPRTDNAERAVRGKRSKKKRLSRPSQDNLNDKNSARYCSLLANGNFRNKKDYWLTLTYDLKYMPKNQEEAEKQVRNFIRRLKDQYKKIKQELKYILVTEYREDEETGELSHFHHHLIINGVLSRDAVEDTWSTGRGKKKTTLGRANCQMLQFSEEGIADLAHYISKSRFGKRGRKKWSSSRNLKRPYIQSNDYKFTPAQIEAMAASNDNGADKLMKIYDRYFITEIAAKNYDQTGWHLYLRMWRNKEVPWVTEYQREQIQENRIKKFLNQKE